MERLILHCDANNFYASVECSKNPALKGYPIAVAGDVEKRHGIILAKSTEAKRMGVSTGEAIWQAKQKCPDLLLLPPDYAAYVKYSNALFRIYTSYTDKVESFGLDECWLDLTDCPLSRDGKAVADEIRAKVKKQLGITVSVGVSFTKTFAKLGSDYKKPDATTVFDRDNYKQLVWPLPVSDLIMVGKQTAKTFASLGIRTIGDLANMERSLLKARMGINGEKLHDFACGVETESVKRYYEHDVPSSVGNGSTAARDIKTERDAVSLIVSLSELVASRLRKIGMKACSVHLSLKNDTLEYASKQVRADAPTNTAEDILNYAVSALRELWNEDLNVSIRAITVTAFNLISDTDGYQRSFFEDEEANDKEETLEKSIDLIRGKYGFNSIKRGSTLNNTFTSDKTVDDQDFRPFKKQ